MKTERNKLKTFYHQYNPSHELQKYQNKNLEKPRLHFPSSQHNSHIRNIKRSLQLFKSHSTQITITNTKIKFKSPMPLIQPWSSHKNVATSYSIPNLMLRYKCPAKGNLNHHLKLTTLDLYKPPPISIISSSSSFYFMSLSKL